MLSEGRSMGRGDSVQLVSDAYHTHDSENGAAFFLATCACIERAEAAVTAPLLLHHG